MAEGEGFEPAVPFQVQRFSRCTFLAALTRGKALTVGAEATKSGSTNRSLWVFFPDRVDYGLLFARAQMRNGHPGEAVGTVADLRKLAVSQGEAARIDLAEASVAAAVSDYKLQQSAAQKAAQKGAAIGASLLTAEALPRAE